MSLLLLFPGATTGATPPAVVAQTALQVRALRTTAVSVSADRTMAVSVSADRTTAVNVKLGAS